MFICSIKNYTCKAKTIVPIKTTIVENITGISIPYLSTIIPTGIFITNIAILYIIDMAKAISIYRIAVLIY